MRYYAWEVPQGRAVALSALLLLGLVAAGLLRLRAEVLLLLALLALVPPLLTGHAAGAGSHEVAQAALVAHVLAAVLWVGGLAGLLVLRSRDELLRTASRFSTLALGCAVAVGVSGVVGAYVRLEDLSQWWGSGYGALLLVKTALFSLLVVAGHRHRRKTLQALGGGNPRSFRRLALGEVVVMAFAFGLAVALSRTPVG